ncbi:lipopolysaccharide biosynthesis protein [Mucilaginibacter terrae]|uniref:O-antigen/teichoic acid export membrane protein n=1 Tax=Mucilaginibacter terrae TaxID=1955052 RepID=A0ABU3GPE8_9SPHI|nr:oligosaccharide flippase family protein [Mucilaginibacter terrae]MDT3401653.1 O-antigen/teichoic acid export membrane protein [Mucilaginibacter terrae]
MLDKIKQILEKLKNPHIVNLVGNAIMSVLNMVQVAILFNYLPKDKMGVWFFFQGTIGLVDTFRAGLITTAFITSYAGTSKDRSAEVAGSAWFLSSLVTLVFIAVNLIYLAIPYHVPDLGTDLVITWFGLVFVITLPSFIASCVAQAEARFDRLLIIRSVSTSLSITLVLTLIITKNINLMNVIYTGFTAGGVTSLMTIVLGWSRINTFWKKSTQTVKALFAFGKYSVGTSLGSSMFRNSDNYIIKIMLGAKGDAAIAVYNLGLRLTELIEIPLRSFAATIMPPLSAAHNQNNKYHVIYLIKKYSGLLTILMIPVVAGSLLFAEVGIWIVDKEYLTTEAANILRIFMSFALLYPIERFMALALDATNQPQVNAVKLVFMLAANIIGDIVGIWLFGNVYGVAFGTLLPILTGMFISYKWLQRYEKFQMWDVYKIGWLETTWIVKDTWSMLFKKKEAKAE